MVVLLVQRACAKLRSAIADEAVLRLNFTRDLREMLEMLEYIQLALENFERSLLLDEDTRRRLMFARYIAYKVIDMADELQDAWPPAAPTMTRLLPRVAIKKNAMATKVKDMKIDVRLLKINCDGLDDPAITQHQQRLMDGRVTVASFVEASVFGRGADKQRIVDVLLSAASNNTQGPTSCNVLPIFGFPGSGKTTLAQMVFNDTHSLQEYNFHVWVHVSPELDFHGICDSILCQVMSGGVNPHVLGMENIMKRLHELLNGSKVLLVLDDLWEEDPIQLQLLKSMLTFLGDKVDVIVTTCNHAIARKFCTIEPYRLNPLDDDTCWEIIKKSVRFKEEHDEREKIGREIASKCWGVPLVAKKYASMLYSQDPTKWEKILETIVSRWSDRLDLKSLILRYKSMPPELKLCVDYCFDIFPNGHNIVKNDLVHQWIALDFVHTSERSSATEIAEEYITRLLDMSFFQAAKLDPASGNDAKCLAMYTMHNLTKGCLPLPMPLDYQSYILVTNGRGKLDNLYNNDARALRYVGCSKVEFNDSLFSSKRYLRVLELNESNAPKLPDSICKLRYLRYLKISDFTELVTLPESFGNLTNLFHLDLSGCSGLVALPESFGKLILLVHANLSGCSRLAVLPESFGDLINLSHLKLSRCHALVELPKELQKLGKLVHLDLSFWSCFEGIGKGLGGLTNLEHLNLAHPCCHLAQQRSHLHGLKDGLCKLTRLRYLNLSMCLNPIFYYKPEGDSLSYIESCVNGLSSLEHLDLSHNTFLFDLPESLGDLNRLHTLDLSGCIRLKSIGQMKSLKFIALKNCRGLESCHFGVRVDDYAPYISSNIVQLVDVNCQELQISCLENVMSIEEARGINLVKKLKVEKLKLSWTLDSLRSAEDSALLEDTVLLEVLVPPPNLECLEVNGYSGTCLPEYLGDLTSLQELKIMCCKQLNCLPDSIEKLTKLKNMCIVDCPELEKWCQLEGNKKMLAHITKNNNEEHGSTRRLEIEEDCRSIDDVEAA